jgi:hypothetical protein
VYFVNSDGIPYASAGYFNSHIDNPIGVRPFCIFNLECIDPLFWHKPETLVGSKIEYGKYTWSVFKTKDGDIYALCDEIIAKRRFDEKTNIWEKSELKTWLEVEGLKLITT